MSSDNLAEPGTLSLVSAVDNWTNHCTEAVRSFLKSVVVIDNEPFVEPPPSQQLPAELHKVEEVKEADSVGYKQSYSLSPPSNFGLGDATVISGVPTIISEKSLTELATGNILASSTVVLASSKSAVNDSDHILDIRKIGDSFANAGLTCAFVLPDYKSVDEGQTVARAIKAVSNADIVVLDWYLSGDASNLTRAILSEIAKKDNAENGRLRMVCIYTGQPNLDGIFLDSKEAFLNGGISLADVAGMSYAAKSSSCLLLVLNKKSTDHSALPEALINSFVNLSRGLVPSFALASVGAIRQNMHHMLTRFDHDLDVAYAANRLITDPPEDVAELMRDLLLAEFDSALTLDSVVERFLEVGAVKKWLLSRSLSSTIVESDEASAEIQKSAIEAVLNIRKNLSSNRSDAARTHGISIKAIEQVEKLLKDVADKVSMPKGPRKIKKVGDVDKDLLIHLLENGIGERGAKSADGKIYAEIEERYRKHVSAFLAGNEASSKVLENKFSRLVGLRREAFGPHRAPWNEEWVPTLSTGTVLRLSDEGGINQKYFVCLTPACDSLRLTQEQSFTFLEAYESSSQHNFVIKNEAGNDLLLRFSTKVPELTSMRFSPDMTRKRVVGSKSVLNGVDTFAFSRGDGKVLTWLGELRYSRAISEVGKITGTWMRIGVIDSEYLRIMGKG
jgi:hypothetical protein